MWKTFIWMGDTVVSLHWEVRVREDGFVYARFDQILLAIRKHF